MTERLLNIASTTQTIKRYKLAPPNMQLNFHHYEALQDCAATFPPARILLPPSPASPLHYEMSRLLEPFPPFRGPALVSQMLNLWRYLSLML